MEPKKKLKPTEMKDLEVTRIDGVDRPATGRKFILFKSEDAVIKIANRIREFLPGDGKLSEQALDAVGEVLEEMAGKGTIEGPRPAWAIDPFLAPTGMYSVAPQPVYGIVEDPGIAPPSAPNFQTGSGLVDNLAAPEMFEAPKPGIRLGESYIAVKGGQFWKGTSAYRPMSEAVEKRAADDDAEGWPCGPSPRRSPDRYGRGSRE